MLKPLGSYIDIIPAIVPVDSQAAANPGDYVSLKNAQGVAIVIFKAAGVANDDPVLTIRQAQDIAGTGVKDFAPATQGAGITRYLKKQGALLTAVGAWTEVLQAAAATITFDATSAESQAVYVVEIEAAELDVDNGFDCIAANIADTGAAGAQLISELYILYGLRYADAPANLPSAIVD